jgi:hypothetical protein
MAMGEFLSVVVARTGYEYRPGGHAEIIGAADM